MPIATSRTRPPLPVDATRRQFLTGVAAAGPLTACSGPPTPAAPANRTFVDGTGTTVQIPDRPGRIYALRDNEMAGLLLSIGASIPTAVAGAARPDRRRRPVRRRRVGARHHRPRPRPARPHAASALWPLIPAIAAGQVHEFDRSLVYTSPLTASAFLDVVETALLPGEPS